MWWSLTLGLLHFPQPAHSPFLSHSNYHIKFSTLNSLHWFIWQRHVFLAEPRNFFFFLDLTFSLGDPQSLSGDKIFALPISQGCCTWSKKIPDMWVFCKYKLLYKYNILLLILSVAKEPPNFTDYSSDVLSDPDVFQWHHACNLHGWIKGRTKSKR